MNGKKRKIRDYDPEDEVSSATSGSEQDSDHRSDYSFGDRDHYEKVGKSRLRQTEQIELDGRYGGAVVSRGALNADSEEDGSVSPSEDEGSEEDQEPFALDQHGDGKLVPSDEDMRDGSEIDDEIDSDEALAASDEEKLKEFVFRGSRRNRMDGPGSDSEGISDVQDDEEEDTIGETDSEEKSDMEGTPIASTKRNDVRALLSTGDSRSSLAATLSAAAASDALKGRAVRQQYSAFDRILDARIKVQKGMAASEQFLGRSTDANDAPTEQALQRAEDAAVSLFNTIDALRQDLARVQTSIQTGSDTTTITLSSSSESLWSRLRTTEDLFLPVRKQTINKWSSKVKSSDPARMADKARPHFSATPTDDRLTDIIDTYVINETDKARETRSDPLLVPSDETFYQSLLRDLISSRSNLSSTIPILPYKLHSSGNKAKSHVVDTKASKGRKIRYTVHEKLQNFTAAKGDQGRDTAQWTERATDEFFGSLLGQTGVLDERNGVDYPDEEMDEAQALRLFRS